ncbi:MAG: Glyoxylate/hydroxypyruvate reductase A [Pseudomonas fluorescens]|nr:MAG: Glyoxylate/hydroxypyruvate reductase A [Pseudomonas fluorescens]
MATVLFASQYQRYDQWRPALLELLPDLDLRQLEDIDDPADVDILLVWTPPEETLQYPNLKLVQCLGAGVDHLVNLPIPTHVPLARLIDRSQVQGFVEYVTAAVLSWHRGFPQFAQAQLKHRWAPQPRVLASQRKVGIMGLGEMGSPCAVQLAHMGFAVRGWSRSPRSLDGVQTFAGEAGLSGFLQGLDVLICVLPLTASTEGILDQTLFAQLAPGAYVINVGRGAHCNEADLCTALDSGQLGGALLDVVSVEPLPQDHPLWSQQGLSLTPHIATSQIASSAAAVAAENIRRIRSGQQPLGQVDRSRSY